MTVAYVAETKDHVLMLDDEGVCVHVHRRHVDCRGSAGPVIDATGGAARCVGAQYVAAIDPAASGFLVEAPTLGAPMLFAKVGPSGKVAVIRTGPLRHFEVRGAEAEDERVTDPGNWPRDTQPMPSPDIRYIPDDDEGDEPTLRSRRLAAALRPPLDTDTGARTTPPFPLMTRSRPPP
jgi:hypothetical protein